MSKIRSDNLSFPETFRESAFSERIALVLATWFGCGLVPFASGTFGTLAAVPLIHVLNSLGIRSSVFMLLIAVAIAVWSSDQTQALLKKKDPSEVVVDEVAGFLLTMALLPYTWLSLCLGFFLFRFFDVLKPFPIKHLEKLKGGFGIVMDDLLAGIYAVGGTWIILFVLEKWSN
jgi:phosphatidylglycerophosphatase A